MSAINEKHLKMLEIVTSFSATWEQLEFTQFHTMSLEAFFTGHEYLKRSRPVAVASCLVLREKNGLNWT